MRGRKPKPTQLHLIEGTLNVTRHRHRLSAEPAAKSGLGAMPAYLSRRAARIWREVARIAFWLGDVDRHKLGTFCSLLAEFESRPQAFPASRIALVRAFGSDLGLTPAARALLALKG